MNENKIDQKERRNYLRSIERYRPRKCRYKRTCKPLETFQFGSGKYFFCVGLSNRNKDLDCIMMCNTVRQRENNKRTVLTQYMTIAEANYQAAVLSYALGNYYWCYNVRDYNSLIRQQIKNTTSKFKAHERTRKTEKD